MVRFYNCVLKQKIEEQISESEDQNGFMLGQSYSQLSCGYAWKNDVPKRFINGMETPYCGYFSSRNVGRVIIRRI